MKNRKRNRLKGYDYSRDNLYFVTICVQGRLCCFGGIIAGIVREGKSRDLSVQDMEGTSSDLSLQNANESNVNQLNSNQSHKIMVLNTYGSIVQNRLLWLETQYPYCIVHHFVVMPNHVHAIIEIDSLNIPDVGIKIKSLSELIGAFKTTSSKLLHESGFDDFCWQRSFHDHIIRNETSYQNIANYIDMNPQRWKEDTFFLNA